MRVLCVYPFFDPAIHELAMVWAEMAANNDVSCRVLAGSADALKGTQASSRKSDLPGLSVRRSAGSIMKSMPSEPMLSWALADDPDIVVTSDTTAHVGHLVWRRSHAPLVVQAENWFDDRMLPRRYYLGVPWLRRAANVVRTGWLGRGAARIMIHCPVEARTLAARGERYAYVPWPHPAPGGASVVKPFTQRRRQEIVCIGSMTRWKGADNLRRYIPHLLANDPHVRVRIIGPALDRAAQDFLRSLSPWLDRCEIAKHMPRAQALATIGDALCVFSSSDLRGWGVIGDAWNMGTPVVGVGEHYELTDDRNALIARSPEAFVRVIAQLRRRRSAMESDRASRHGLRTHEPHDRSGGHVAARRAPFGGCRLIGKGLPRGIQTCVWRRRLNQSRQRRRHQLPTLRIGSARRSASTPPCKPMRMAR